MLRTTLSRTTCATPWLACLLGLLCLATATPAHAQEREDTHRWSALVGGGFTLSPDGGLLTTGLDYRIAPHLHVGPLLQLAGDDDVLIVAPSANLRYGFDLSSAEDPALRRLEPYVQGGIGLAYIDKDRPGRDRDDAEMLLNGGVGVEYWVDPRVAVGSGILLNGMPTGRAAGERFFFSWQLLTARVRF